MTAKDWYSLVDDLDTILKRYKQWSPDGEWEDAGLHAFGGHSVVRDLAEYIQSRYEQKA